MYRRASSLPLCTSGSADAVLHYARQVPDDPVLILNPHASLLVTAQMSNSVSDRSHNAKRTR